MQDATAHDVQTDAQLEALKIRIEEALDARLPRIDSSPQRLHEAMRYATLGGGKRVRAMLVYGQERSSMPRGIPWMTPPAPWSCCMPIR